MKILINKPTHLLKLITIMLITLTYTSCKKNDLGNENLTIELKGKPDPEKARQNALAQIKKLGGLPQIFTTNKSTDFYWVDKNKNKVDPTAQNNLVSACNWDYPAYVNLVQYGRIFQCSIGGSNAYKISYKYRLSWNNNVVLTNNTFGNQTMGTVWIQDIATGAIDYNGTAYTDISNLIDLGPDPAIPGNNIFEVNFICNDPSNPIPGFLLEGNTHQVRINAEFATDCTNGDAGISLWTDPIVAFGYTDASTNDPCKRNDKVWPTPPGLGGNGTNILEVISFNPLSLPCYDNTFITPDLSQIEYNIDGSSNWIPMIVTQSLTGIYLGRYYFMENDYGVSGTLPSGTHIIGLRYRNWKFTPPNGLGPDPDYSIACGSPGNLTTLPSPITESYRNSTYAYEYYRCIIP
jgi:hypothetical protein